MNSSCLSTKTRVLGLLTLLVAARSVASAQSHSDGFATNRFISAPRGSDWFQLDSLDLRGHLRPAIGAVLDWGHQLLVIHHEDDTEQAIVGNQLFLQLGGTLTLWNRIRFGAILPVEIWRDGTGGVVNGVDYSASGRAGFGDLRLGADFRVRGSYGAPLALAAGGTLVVPTGATGAYAGDGTWGGDLHAAIAGELGRLSYAARLALRYRSGQRVDGTPLASELEFGGALGVRVLDRRILAGIELAASTGISNGDALFGSRSSPMEMLFGVHYYHREFRFGLAAGPGLTKALGTPAARLVVTFEWAPPLASAAAPIAAAPATQPEPAAATPATQPEPAAATTTEPEPDPEPDRDDDRVIDTGSDDACPESVESAGHAAFKRGCPDVRVDTERIVLLEPIEFGIGSDVILPMSTPLLGRIVETIAAHTELRRVEVRGHTDGTGSRVANQRLSERRAAAVVKWLVKHGIAANRLVATGFGMSVPVASNATAAGQRRNRRVEFHIVEVRK